MAHSSPLRLSPVHWTTTFNSLTLASVLVVLIVVLAAILGPSFLGLGNDIDTLSILKPPSAEHWFGTDNVGRDVFARTVSGSRSSLLVGVGTTILVVLVGGSIGLACGYASKVDRIVMRIMDGFMAIPSIILAVALASILGNGLVTVIIAIAVPEVPRMARLMRSVVLALVKLPYVDAAVSVGSSRGKILLQHIVPNAIGPLLVQATFVCASAILSEAYLGFLGVGIPPEMPSWGNVIAGGRQYFQLAPWIIASPGVCLSLLVLATNLLGDSLRDRIDPTLRGR